MRFSSILAGLACLWMAAFSFGATTPLKLICLSVQVDPAMTDEFGIDYQLSITADNSEINSEITPAGDDFPFTHQGWFILESDIFGGDPIVLPFGIDLFTDPDDNQNAFPDFFEANQPFAARIEGEYQNLVSGQKPFTADWTREAGSSSGTVRIALPEFGLTFDTAFRIFEYTGTFESTRTEAVVSGTISLVSGLDPAETLSGPVSFTVQPDPRTLAWGTGTWQGTGGVAWNYDSLGETLDLDLDEYFGVFAFQDGLPATGAEDYGLWIIQLSAQDANSNGTPDVIETGGAPAERPSLDIIRTPDGFTLTVTGKAGQQYTLEASSQVETGWTAFHTFTMSGATEPIALSNDQVVRFFRIKL